MSIATLPDDPLLRERFGDIKPPLAAAGGRDRGQSLPELLRRSLHRRLPDAYRCSGIYQAHRHGQPARLGAAHSRRECAGGSCARACPVEVLCEGACVMHRYNREPIQIALLQRHAMDAFHATGEELLTAPRGRRNVRVACIGGGPASLACAAEFADTAHRSRFLNGAHCRAGSTPMAWPNTSCAPPTACAKRN